ncbi:LacI family DNA-binding transcriptional regulator [Kribbella sp. NPDC050459]|uniref:LacI family DNA-binding transcriptional regulator n=1 Tax=Kribbella sp. NPDC050459 TaxID=3155785 RepID=UPI0033DC7563
MTGTRKAVTLSDVAQLAGVSLSIASKALRGGGRMTPATRQRVVDAAATLKFRPNTLAQSFAQGRSLVIGVVVEHSSDLFTMPVVMGVTSTLGNLDLAVLVYDASEGPERRTDVVAKLRARMVDGILVVGDGTKHPVPSITGEVDVPVVYAFCESESARDTSFMPDGFGAGRMVAEHLIGLGRRKIAHITSGNDTSAASRSAGLVAGLADAGLSLALTSPLVGDWSQAWGMTAAREILRRREDVDAVFCGNDQLAVGAQRVFRSEGVRVPEDIAIVGYDNLNRLVESAPLITTVDPELYRLGGTAARYLVESGAEREPGVQHLPCTLIPGWSTQPDGARPAASFADDAP